MPKRAPSIEVPRRWRLPHPPPAFTGRTEELAWIEEAFARGPVCVLAGPAGIGKSALATVVAAQTFGSERCLVVAASARDSALTSTVDVIQALAARAGVDAPASLETPDARVDATLELAAGFDGLLVVDGLATHQPEAERWLEEMARHATDAKVLVTGRGRPSNARAHGQTLVLGPLDAASARALAATWAPETSPELQLRAARDSRGHPAELQRLLRGAPESKEPDDALLRLLGAIGQPVPLEVVRLLAPDSSRAALLASGQLRPVGRGYEPWRESWAPPEDEARERALRDLILHGSAEATLAAIGLLARTGARPERLQAVLDERGEALLDAGYTARLWSALGELPSAELESWQLRCAERLGNPTVLARTHRPEGETPADRLAWARTLLARGKPDEARAFAAPLLEEGTPAALEAALLVASAAGRSGDYEGALEALEHAGSVGETTLGLRVAQCRWALEAGELDAARPLGTLARELEGADAKEETWCDLAAACERRGELRAALQILDNLEHRRRGGIELLTARVAALIRAWISVERGDPTLARSLAEMVAPYTREPSALAPRRTAVELAARWLIGDLTAFDSVLALARNRAAGRDAPTERRLASLDARVRCALGETPTNEDGSGPAALWAARWGHAPEGVPSADRRDGVWHFLAVAAAALARGDALAATKAAQDGAGEAERWGFVELGLEAHALRAEALASTGELRTLAEAAEELQRRAKAAGSERFALRARFFGALAGGRLDPATAEMLAARAGTAPTVARWARVALGAAEPLDRADATLLGALREQGSLGEIRTLEHSDGAGVTWRPAWGLDLAERVVWLPDGQRLALGSRAVQWRILECLASSEGLGVDKETLVQRAWDEREYHPGKHDGRLYVAIRKLRAAIEDDPSAPERLRTTEDGYGLGRPFRIARG